MVNVKPIRSTLLLGSKSQAFEVNGIACCQVHINTVILLAIISNLDYYIVQCIPIIHFSKYIIKALRLFIEITIKKLDPTQYKVHRTLNFQNLLNSNC